MSKEMDARVEQRELSSSRPHPGQGHFFGDLSATEVQMLAEDIAQNGLQYMIEILPGNAAGLPVNTILTGHQRRRALELNGETEADVWVRYDLADADSATIERALLEENLNRRQLDKCDMARILEIERGRLNEGERPS
jgi:ParB-like chromosome segregation protein Spo0J